MRAHDSVLIVDAAEVGMRGIGGHGHNDVLSTSTCGRPGAPLLVDRGLTSIRPIRPPASAAQHRGPQRVAPSMAGLSLLGADRWLWLIENDAHPQDVAWASDAAHDALAASHDGYQRLSKPVMHRRSIVFERTSRAFASRTPSRDRASIWWSCSCIRIRRSSPRCRAPTRTGRSCSSAPRGDLWLLPPVGIPVRIDRGWVSAGYGLRRAAPVLVYAVRSCRCPSLCGPIWCWCHTAPPASVARSLVGRD